MTPPHVNLTMLRVLDALAEEGSHTRAGERLGLTQSGVSHAMRAWEDLIGRPLVVRQGRRVSLSPTGEAVLREVRGALVHLHAIGRLGADRTVTGHVRLGAVVSAAIGIVPQALDALRHRHPAVTVEMIEGTDGEIATWLAQGILDVAISMADLGERAERLTSAELVAVLPPRHPLSDRRAVSARDLARHPFVMSSSGCEDAIQAHVATQGATLDVALTIRDTRALLAAVRGGLGLSVLPALSLGDAEDRTMVRPLDPPLRRDLHLAIAPHADDAAQAMGQAITTVR